ncbi:hypothetical protein SLA2020_453780 [Shorea laevis]
MEHKIERFWELPEPVLEHILSLIPLKRLLQLSLLSKRWQNVWCFFPLPEFNSNFCRTNSYQILDHEKKQQITIKSEERDKFNYFVEKTLVSRCRQKLSINKFNLKMMVMDEPDYVLVNRWIGYAIESNVKELSLELRCFYYETDEGLTIIWCLRGF